MVNDPIGDMLIQIKNAALAGKKVVELPHSKLKHAVAKILVEEGYISSIEKIGDAPKHQLRIVLKYDEATPIISDVRRVSKPGLRVYVSSDRISKVVGGLGITILSTSMGILTGEKAKKKGIGGELLCEVW